MKNTNTVLVEVERPEHVRDLISNRLKEGLSILRNGLTHYDFEHDALHLHLGCH